MCNSIVVRKTLDLAPAGSQKQRGERKAGIARKGGDLRTSDSGKSALLSCCATWRKGSRQNSSVTDHCCGRPKRHEDGSLSVCPVFLVSGNNRTVNYRST